MNRRSVLLSAGTVFSLGAFRLKNRDSTSGLSIKIWLTEDAAAYRSIRERAIGFVRQTLTRTGRNVEISVSEVLQRFTGDDRHIERRAWPQRVIAGSAGLSPINPVSDVNLLITDGRIFGSTAGYAFDHIAAVPGARFLAEMHPANETPLVVDYSLPAAVTHLLIHEVGHALGLDHSHGTINVTPSSVTASPMVSAYAWAPEEVQRTQLTDSTCADDDLSVSNQQRHLRMQYSSCAETAIRSYRNNLFA